MKKAFLALLLVVVLTVALAVPAMAAEPAARTQCMCGQTTSGYSNCANCGTTPQRFSPWTDTTSLPTSGRYYLVYDVALTSSCVPTNGWILGWNTLSIDLNGKTVSANGAERLFEMNNQYSKLNLTDTSAEKTGRLDYSNVTTGESWGLAIKMGSNNTTVDMYGGTVSGTRSAGTGGAAVIITSSAGTNSVFNLHGGTLTGGIAGRWGGNVLLHTGVFNMYGGEISGGSASMYESQKPGGGNIYVNQAATLNITGGTVSGGSAPMGTSIVVYGKMTMSGGQITGAAAKDGTGAVHIRGNGSLEVSGTAKIMDNLGANVYLPAAESFITDSNGTEESYDSKTLTCGTLSGDAKIGVTLADHSDYTADSRVFTTGTQAAYFVSDDPNCEVKPTDSGLVLTRAGVYKLNGTGNLDSFAACVEKADFAKKDFIQLQEAVDSVTITEDVYLDLNGYTVDSVSIAEGVTLYAFDSKTSDYDAADCGRIAAKTGSGTIARAFVNSASHRYLMLQDTNGYTFHRFYLAVTHTVMSPDFEGMRFKVTLKCNAVVANAINNGGEFGIDLQVNGNQPIHAPFGNVTVIAGENTAVLGTESSNEEKVKAYMEAAQKCNAYITVGGETITSAVKNRSMKQMILGVMNTQWDTQLDVLQRDLMGDVYRRYAVAAEMDTWGTLITDKLKPGAGPVEKHDCICGDQAAVGTPCADAGHKSVQWKDLTGTALPTQSGYYRLTDDLEVTGEAEILANNHVVIDLNGYTITQTKADTRLFVLNASNARLTVTDHTGGGMVIPVGNNNLWGMIVNMDAGSARFDMYGGILNVTGIPSQYGTAIVNRGTTNMYGGAITGGNSVNGGGSVMVYNGTFNQYGGIIENGTSESTGGEYFGGGNVRVSSTGTFCMYGGTVRNGNSVGPGGNIHNQGTVKLYGGTVIGGSTASKGGGIFMNGSTITVSGMPEVSGNAVSDIYLASGKKIAIADAGLKDGASIGVYASQFTGAFTTTANATAANGKYFFSNLESFSTAQVRDGALVMSHEGYAIGFASANINPTPDLYGKVGLLGYSNESTRLVTSVDENNPLKAICLAVADGKGNIAVLVSVDTACIDTNVAKAVTQNIVNKYGIPEQSIMFSSNHQHSTPAFSKGYQTLAIEKITAAIEEAMADMKRVAAMDVQTVDVGANQFNFVRNYQYVDANGNPIPGAMSTDNHNDAPRLEGSLKMQHESTADSNVQLLRIRRDGEKDILLVNFQMHPLLYTGGSDRVAHADIVGKFRNALEAKTGCEAMYFTGASGNINPFSRIDSSKSSSNLAAIDQGANLAAAVVAGMKADAWENAMGTGESKVSTITRTFDCDVRLNTDDVPQWYIDANPGKTVEELAEARLIRAKEICPNGDNNFVGQWTQDDLTNYAIYSKYHAKHMVLRSAYSAGQTQARDISVLAFGDVAFAVASYEMFDTNGMEIKEGSPYKMTFIATMGYMPHTSNALNGVISRYIPSALGYQNGGYSVDITHFAAGTGEMLRDGFLAMLKDM